MANRYQTFREADLGAGIDNQSSENRIPPGYAEDIENMDPQSQGQIRTRPGYQGYAGHVPVRVERVEYTDDSTNNLCFFLDGSVDLTSISGTPIIVQGRTSSDNTSNVGDFPNDSDTIEYYSTFTTDFKKTFLTGTNTLAIPQTEHTLSTEFMFVGVTESTSVTDNDNTIFTPDAIKIDKGTFDIDIDYTNGTGSAFDGFVYISDKSNVTGTTFVSTITSIGTGTGTFTVTAATHGLNTFNIIAKIYEDDGSDLIEVQPDEMRILTNGNVEFDITNGTGSAYDARFILTAVASSNVETGTIAASATDTIVINNITSDFLFLGIYLEPTIGGTLEMVLPDSVVVDASAQTATVTFTNGTASGKNFEIYYEFANIATNKLCVTGTTITTPQEFTDNRPQLTIWGLPHTELYGSNRTAREGWVSHIDSYRSTGEDRLICGLGGNLFSAQLSSESSNDTTYLMPTRYPNIRGRSASDQIVGPAFVDTTDTSTRTRGHIQASTAGNNFLEITSAAYQSGTGYVRYTLSAPSLSVNGTLSTIIDTTTGTEDRLTVQQMGYSRLNGTFKIKAVTTGTDTITIDVDNSQVTSSDFDESDAGGLGGIFTDRLTLSATSVFQEDDTAASEVFDNYTVIANSGTIVILSNILAEVTVPSGLRITGTRTTDVIPMRLLDGTADIENIVRGDMLTWTPVDRLLRAKFINTNSDISISIVGNGSSATVTLGSGDTSNLTVGQKILIRGTSNYNGAQEIATITSTTVFTFDSTQTTTEGGTLVGKTIHLDESLEVADTTDSSNLFTVHSRWIPVEAPDDSFDLTPSTYIQHFDSKSYTSQDILRSVMVQDNLYFTNGSDEVMKFDGTNVYRAGLFRWQPHLFVSTDTTATGKIVLENPSIDYTASSANRFTVAQEDRLTFQVGQEIEDSIDNERYIVTDTLDDGTNAQIVVDREIQSTFVGTPTLTKVANFRYYFRLNAVDANDNLIASAVTGANDFVIGLAADAAINIRLVGMPAWDIYDYDRLEVQIYRTQSDQVAPYYRLTTLPMSFNSSDGYLNYVDTDSDEDLRDLDEVNTALYGAELGTGISEPLRAKYCTSADNRLILSNITDYPTIDLQIIQNSTGPITISDLIASGNEKYLFRIDNTDTGTVTDMVNRATYEFVDTSGAVTLTPNTDFSEPSTDVLEVASPAHGLSVGDWVYFYHSAVADANNLDFTGWFQVAAVPGAGTFRVNTVHAKAGTTADVDRYVTATTTTDIPVLLGTDGNYSMLNGNRGSTESYEFLAMRRLANAINCTMRKVDTSITAMSSFVPWMIGQAGNEFNVGQLIIKQPKVLSTTMELVLPALTGVFDVFINSLRRSASAQAGAVSRVFPSRSLISFPNFPEIFDNPVTALDIDSQSAIDVNSADGQEITANIPFFGESAFGAANQDAIIVVFKENSIYLLNTVAKSAGTNALQKIESEGKGCTAPFSVAVTKAGIMFANFAGIYRLNRSNQIDYVGRKAERIWREQVNRDQLAIATGHHFANGNKYKLSVPNGTNSTENNEVMVYNHTREYEGEGRGSWATYTNHAATGWANLLDDAYFATVDGQVYSIRRTGGIDDARDDDQGISWKLLVRAMDFGDSGIRKTFGWVITHYRTLVETSTISLKSATNLREELAETDSFTVEKAATSDSLGDEIDKKVVSIKSSLKDRIGNYLQLEYSGSTIDQPVEISGIDIRVAPQKSKGITEAASTGDS